MSGELTFRVGDAVVVKAGVMDPDNPSVSLAGWQGWVTEIYPDGETIEFHWDSATLHAIPDDYIRQGELEGLAWHLMVLDANDVALTTPRYTLQKAQTVYEEIMSRHAWDHLADENPGIAQLLGPLGTPMR